jgi:anaerobic selenocysteine-containing dehydrogenase
MEITRRVLLKGMAATGAAVTVGQHISSLELGPEGLFASADVTPRSPEKIFTVVGDVDAHSQCRMGVRVTGNQVTEVLGDSTDPESKGELTVRDKHMREILYAPDRLRYPLKRIGEKGKGKWKRISWNEALMTIANRLNEIKKRGGAEAIHFLHGHYHSGDIIGIYIPRLANLIGTPNVSNPSHVCHLPRVFLQYNFDFGAIVPPDVVHTNCLILWGGNPEATNKPQEIAIKEARKRGIKLIVIDPRKTSYAEEADLHAQLRPGTDGALALGMLNVIIKEGLYDKEFVNQWTVGFERLAKHVEDYPPEKVEKITWVPALKIRAMARMYATIKPACISPRNALDQHTNASCAIRAIDMLMAITGNLDVKGGNLIVIPISMGLEDLKLYEKLPPEAEKKKIGTDKSLYSNLSKIWPSAHMPSVWDAITQGNPYPIKAMFVMAANPVLTCANTNVVETALRKLEFLVVADLFMSPTAELADIVLPACTSLETTRFVTYDTHADHGWNVSSRIAISPKVVEPLWESWADWKIICELGRKMGYGEYFPWKTEEEAIDCTLKPLGITCEELRHHPEGIVISTPPFLYKKLSGFFGSLLRGALKIAKFRNYPNMYKKYEANGFMTPSKKVEIYSEQLEKLGYDPLPVYKEPAESPFSKPDLAKSYPLILIAGSKLEMYTHSMMRNIPELSKQFPKNLLEIHPETAKKLTIKNGELVKVESPRGSINSSACVTDRIDPRVVHLYHGFEESNCNVLTDHKAIDPITGSTGLKSLLCRVTKVSPHPL